MCNSLIHLIHLTHEYDWSVWSLISCDTCTKDKGIGVTSWSSKISPRCLTELDGIIVEEPNWMVKSYCRLGVAGKTRSSVFSRLSCR